MNLMHTSAYTRDCPYLYRGKVEDNKDPLNIGRCKIRVPSVHGELTYPVSILPWARPVVLSPVSSQKGSVNIPDIGDIVWVLFEGAQKEFPVYFGGTYAKDELDIDNDIVVLHTEGDSKVSYHRRNKEYTIQIGDTSIILSRESIKLIGDVEITGNLTVGNNLTIAGSCNKECNCG